MPSGKRRKPGIPEPKNLDRNAAIIEAWKANDGSLKRTHEAVLKLYPATTYRAVADVVSRAKKHHIKLNMDNVGEHKERLLRRLMEQEEQLHQLYIRLEGEYDIETVMEYTNKHGLANKSKSITKDKIQRAATQAKIQESLQKNWAQQASLLGLTKIEPTQPERTIVVRIEQPFELAEYQDVTDGVDN